MVAYLILLLIILVGTGIGCLFLPRRRLHAGLKSADESMPETPAEPAAPAPRHPPGFLEELQSKERSVIVDSTEMGRSGLDLREIHQKEKAIAANPAPDRHAKI
jgi:hypothetical protein